MIDQSYPARTRYLWQKIHVSQKKLAPKRQVWAQHELLSCWIWGISLRQPDDNLEIDSLCCHVGWPTGQKLQAWPDLVKAFDISPFGLLLATTGGIKFISPYKVTRNLRYLSATYDCQEKVMPFCYQPSPIGTKTGKVRWNKDVCLDIFSKRVVHHLPFGERSSLAQGNIELYPYPA